MTHAAPPKMTAVEGGTEQGIDWCICNAPLWGAINGYVRIPEDHPWSGKDYDDIDVDAWGGLTFSRDGWIGFDTLHAGDLWPGGGGTHFCAPDSCDCRVWTVSQIIEETKALARRAAEAVSA